LPVRPGSVGHQIDHDTHRLSFFEQEFSLLRIVLWPGTSPFDMPRTVPGKDAGGNITAPVKYRLVYSLKVGAMSCSLAQQYAIGCLVRKWAAFHVVAML